MHLVTFGKGQIGSNVAINWVLGSGPPTLRHYPFRDLSPDFVSTSIPPAEGTMAASHSSIALLAENLGRTTTTVIVSINKYKYGKISIKTNINQK